MSELAPYWHGIFKDKVFFTYRRCAGCAQLYSPAYFHERQLQTLYSEMAANMDIVDESALDRTAEEYLNVLKRFSPLRGTFMEIGPDVGAFAGKCAAAGSFDAFRLFEPNLAVHDALRAAIGRPQQTVEEYFTGESVADATVDVAAMIHVLDHVLEPKQLAKDIRRTLKPQGCLMIVTHDERSTLARVLRGRWPAYCLQHPQLFNRQSMKVLLNDAGYSRVDTVLSTNVFPVTFLIEQLALALKLPIKGLPKLPWLRVGLKLGNFITIARP
jgi:SAM-dependent methyltransferase